MEKSNTLSKMWICNKQTTNILTIFVNGKKVVEENVNPEWTLLYYLRNKLALCGTKLGCGEGGCGACTVMISKYLRTEDRVVHYPVNACLTPVCSVHGLAVTTVEGIGSTKTRLHPVQERIAKAHGSQCGFCTPGIVMSMYALLRSMPKPKIEDLEIAFQGNLCRCTGYRPIIEGYKTFTEDWERMRISNGITNGNGVNGINGSCGMGDKCCKLQNGYPDEEKMFVPSKFIPYDSSQEPIFPPELKLVNFDQPLEFKGKNVTWYRPTTLEHFLELKQTFPHAKIVVGNTEIGVEVKFKNALYPIIIQPTLIKEFNEIIVQNDKILIGSAVTLDAIEKAFRSLLISRKQHEVQICNEVVQMLNYFAGKQIRSVASIGGNIMTGSPISDLNPIWMAAGARLHLKSLHSSRVVRMDEKFYVGYRRTILEPNEILHCIEIPFTTAKQYFYAYKQARRRDDDIAIVNAAFNVMLSNDHQIESIAMAFGGMAATTIMPNNVSTLVGQEWNESMLEKAYAVLIDDLPLTASAPGGMIDYRRALPMSFFFKTYLRIRDQLHLAIDAKDRSAMDRFTFKPPKSSQYFQVVDKKNVSDTIGRPIVHTNALNQATGEAIYLDDMPRFEHELCLAFVYSTKAHAKVLSIDMKEAMKMDNVVDCLVLSDIPKDRNVTGIMRDEQYIRDGLVTCQYQILAGIIATDQASAQRAAKAVQVTYEELPGIFTIEQAIENKSFYDKEAKLNYGNVEEAFVKCDHILHGEARTSYQEHFYMEPHAFLAVPKEGCEIDLYATSQDQCSLADETAQLLEIDQNKVICKIKRIGGGFGGKETTGKKFAPLTALAAKKTKQPVRLVMDRDEDMGATGGRNPFLVKYKVGFNGDGRIMAAQFEIYVNAGHSYDMSLFVMFHGASGITNSCHIPNVKINGKLCKTNLPTNNAFRGFGIPQCMFVSENMFRKVGEFLGKDYVELMRINLFNEGERTPFNQPLLRCNVRRCFEEVLVNADFERRRHEVEEFNRKNRWKKRGIDIVATTYGVGYGLDHLQQASASVLIYKDGSVLLNHAGVEMGQGLHTKLIQICSTTLNIPVDKIHTTEVSTDKIPNSLATAASLSSDLWGMAIKNACDKLNNRLEPIKLQNPKGTWNEWILSAFMQRVCLIATGFHKEPELNWNWETGVGDRLYNYFTFGASCTEVEIDCLTGDHQVLRTDIVMDLGNSLNPAIDVGQIEGGFMQGYGLFLMEEMVTSLNGTYMSKGPGAYKIPGFNDIPIEFNVALLKDSSNPRAVYSSKAIGEPPLFLAASAFFAIREAIKAARQDSGSSTEIELNAPLTAERIRMACADNITSKIPSIKSIWKFEYL